MRDAELTLTTTERARASQGASGSDALFRIVREVLTNETACNLLVDVGCGTGQLYHRMRGCYRHYLGIDILRYPGFPESDDASFLQASVDDRATTLPEAIADVVCCIETIEHVENPRDLMRRVSRLLKPGGLAVVTTPNQLSLLSKLCLIVRNEFVHFQARPGLYPSHITALLEIDLRRLAAEVGWIDVEIVYSGDGRIPGTARHWPRLLAAHGGRRGRAFSDNVMLIGRTPR